MESKNVTISPRCTYEEEYSYVLIIILGDKYFEAKLLGFMLIHNYSSFSASAFVS